MKEKLDETSFQTDIQQVYDVLKFILSLYPGKNSCYLSFRFELNGHQRKSTPWHFGNSPPMDVIHVLWTILAKNFNGYVSLVV